MKCSDCGTLSTNLNSFTQYHDPRIMNVKEWLKWREGAYCDKCFFHIENQVFSSNKATANNEQGEKCA